MIHRRDFLKIGATGLGSLAAAHAMPEMLANLLGGRVSADSGKGSGQRKQLIVIFQRGAMDGLNALVPHYDDNYYSLRPTLAVPRPKKGEAVSALDLDGRFGLNPNLAPFLPLFQSGKLACITAVGSPDNTRSHFDAQDYMESGTPGRKSTPDGWLNRYLQTSKIPNATPFRAVSMTQLTPRTMQGKAEVVAMANLNDFNFRAGNATGRVTSSFEEMYARQAADALRGTGQETVEAVKFLKKANPSRFQPENGAKYPTTPFGNAMKQIGQLIKADVGLEVAFTDIGGWDTHVNQGAPNQPFGALNRNLKDLGETLGAFSSDMGTRMDNILVVTMTEFGRTVRQNGTGGTDHGHGSAMFALGAGVKGGKVYGDLPKLTTTNLYEGRDVPVTTDFRDVFAEVLSKHLGDQNLAPVLPGYQVNKSKFLNFLA